MHVTFERYNFAMDAIPDQLSNAARQALGDLDRSSRAVARGADGRTAQTVLAEAARTAVFADAVLSAVHARLEEFKGLTR